MKIAIVGAGPGGLTLARLLQIKNLNVTVYERDAHKDARTKGATLDLHEESGLRALREGGLMDAFMANYRPGADKMRIVDKQANILFDDDAGADPGAGASSDSDSDSNSGAASARDRSRPEIDRGPLQNILLESLQPGTVQWDRHFMALSPQDGSWNLTFRDGSFATADIVIAADGANSKLRSYITPIKPFYTGVTAIEGAVHHSETAVPGIHRLLNGGKIFALGDEKSLIVSSKGDGSLVFYTSGKTDEQWSRECGIDFSDKASVLAWFKQEYAGWDNLWQELFENATGPFVPRPQYCMPLDQVWEPLPNLTLLGDAAHLMPPFTGEGVNMAMLDAVELSECLTGVTGLTGVTRGGFPDTQAAIAAYEKRMRSRASEAARDSLQATTAMHSPDAISFVLATIGAA